MKAVTQPDGTIRFETWNPNEWVQSIPEEIDWEIIPKTGKNYIESKVIQNLLFGKKMMKNDPEFLKPYELMYPDIQNKDWICPTMIQNMRDFARKQYEGDLAHMGRWQLYLAYLLTLGLPFEDLMKSDGAKLYRIVTIKNNYGNVVGGATDDTFNTKLGSFVAQVYDYNTELWGAGMLSHASPMICKF